MPPFCRNERVGCCWFCWREEKSRVELVAERGLDEGKGRESKEDKTKRD